MHINVLNYSHIVQRLSHFVYFNNLLLLPTLILQNRMFFFFCIELHIMCNINECIGISTVVSIWPLQRAAIPVWSTILCLQEVNTRLINAWLWSIIGSKHSINFTVIAHSPQGKWSLYLLVYLFSAMVTF